MCVLTHTKAVKIHVVAPARRGIVVAAVVVGVVAAVADEHTRGGGGGGGQRIPKDCLSGSPRGLLLLPLLLEKGNRCKKKLFFGCAPSPSALLEGSITMKTRTWTGRTWYYIGLLLYKVTAVAAVLAVVACAVNLAPASSIPDRWRRKCSSFLLSHSHGRD